MQDGAMPLSIASSTLVDQGLRAWLRVCAASLREDRAVRAPQDTLPVAAPTPGGLRGLILHAPAALGRRGSLRGTCSG